MSTSAIIQCKHTLYKIKDWTFECKHIFFVALTTIHNCITTVVLRLLLLNLIDHIVNFNMLGYFHISNVI